MAYNTNVKVITDKNGTKLYPIGSIYKLQHVIMNYYDRIGVQKEFTQHELEVRDAVDNYLYEFSCNGTYMGMYYSDYKHGKLIREVINGYVDRHGGQL